MYISVTVDERKPDATVKAANPQIPTLTPLMPAASRHSSLHTPIMQYPTWQPWRLQNDMVWYPSYMQELCYQPHCAGDHQAAHVLQLLSRYHQNNVAITQGHENMKT